MRRSRSDGEGRNRTGDTTIFSRVLYQLSYLARRASLASFEAYHGQPHHVFAAARAVIGGDEVAADPQREGEDAARLDVVLVRREAPNSERM